MGIGGEGRRTSVRPDLVDVLNDDERLAYGLVGMEENGDLFVNGVGFK